MIALRHISRALALTCAVWLAAPSLAADAAPVADAAIIEQNQDADLQIFLENLAQYEASGDYKKMLERTRLWQQARPQDAQIWFIQGRASFYSGDYSSAIASWEQAQKLDPALGAAEWIDRARALKKWGNQVPFQLVDGEITEAKNAWNARGRELLAAKNYDEIERVAAQLTQSKESFADGRWAFTFFIDGVGERNYGSEAQWESRRADIEAWAKARPDSILARVCLARAWNNGAWLARGGDWSSPDGAGKIIEERDDKAAAIIESAGGWTKLMAATPLSFDVFEGWAMLTGRAAETEFFNRQLEAANAAFPQYADAYKGDAYHLLARWYGQKNEWQQKAGLHADAYGKKFGAEAGDALYAQIVWLLARSYTDTKTLWTDEETDWPRTKRGMQSILRTYPDSLAGQTFLFDAATLNQDWPSALEALQKLNGRVDNEYYYYRRKGLEPQRLAVLEHSSPPIPNP